MTSAYAGNAFGLRFVSNQPLPEFQGAVTEPASAPVVTVHWHAARPQRALPAPERCQWSGSTFSLGIPDVCDFDVTAERIDAHPAPGVPLAEARAFLQGSAIGALLHVRGTLVLHGSAVRTHDGTAALFCGHSTAGKSTLAASLAQQGLAVLADDLSALRVDTQGRPICQPGLARTKLWRDALQRLGLEQHAGPQTQVQPSLDKHCLPMQTSLHPAPLTRVYELSVDESSQSPLTIVPVQGMHKLTVLLTHVYRPHYLKAMGRQNELLTAFAGVLRDLEVVRITRPRQGDTLPAIVDWLLGKWRDAPTPHASGA